jgi:SAM-dependent methyltransferase
LVEQHRDILSKKKIMKEIFREFYDRIRNLDLKYFSGVGARIEIGAGVSFMRETYPDVQVTDIKSAPHLDCVMDALDTKLPERSVRAIYGINCFHHFPNVRKFFGEMDRVLIPGGGVILIEPYFGPFASLIYKNLSATEIFDKSQPTWDSPSKDQGVMTGANQALSFLVFVRDRALFERLFPQFEVVEMRTFKNYLRYLLSGGLNFQQLIPNCVVPYVKFLEFILRPVASLFSLHYVIVLRKRTK